MHLNMTCQTFPAALDFTASQMLLSPLPQHSQTSACSFCLLSGFPSASAIADLPWAFLRPAARLAADGTND